MAIRFVDKGPEDAEPDAGRKPRGDDLPPAAPIARGPVPAGTAAPDDARPAEGDPTPLAHAKPEPKPRGRKKPLSAAGKAKDSPSEKAVSSEGAEPSLARGPAASLLPGLDPSPTPPAVDGKPAGSRRRKAAFG